MTHPATNRWPKIVVQYLLFLATSMALNLGLDAFTPIHGWVAAGIGALVAAFVWLTLAPMMAPSWFPFAAKRP